MAYLDPKKINKPAINKSYTEEQYIQDTIGNRQDTSFSNGNTHPSIAGSLKANYYHVHDSAKVYPTGAGELGADPVPIASEAVTPWTHGVKTQVVPVNIIDKYFDIHWIIVSNITEADDYELRVYKGASESEIEIGRIAFSRNATQDRASYPLPIQIPPQAPNTRISMSLACGDGDGASCEVKIYYHTYPDIT